MTKNTHDLTGGTPVVKIFAGLQIGTTSDGYPLYQIDGKDWEQCSS